MVEQLYTNARTDTYKHPSRYVGAAVGIGRSARSGWVELGWRMGRSGATRPHFGGVSTFIRRDRYVWLGRSETYSAKVIRMVGAERGLFGGIGTYGRGRPVESKPPPEGCTLRIGIAWLIDRNTEIALSVRRNCFIRTQELLYSCAGIALLTR